MEESFGIENPGGFRLISWRLNYTRASRAARAPFRNARKALLIAAELPRNPHHAVMLPISAAAGGKICVGTSGEGRRNQRPTEKHHQRKCNRSAHNRQPE
jgi:hypothetical protein